MSESWTFDLTVKLQYYYYAKLEDGKLQWKCIGNMV